MLYPGDILDFLCSEAGVGVHETELFGWLQATIYSAQPAGATKEPL